MSAPSLNYAEVLDYFIASDMAKSKKLAAKASKQFVAEIGIAPRNMGEELTQSMFLEWFLFDYEVEPGMTLAKSYAYNPPADADPALVAELKQVVDTQFCAIFWVDGVAPLLNITTLEEAETGERYAVHNEGLAHSVVPGAKGALGCRICKIDGEWYLPGDPVFYFLVEPTEQLKESLHLDNAKHATFTSLIVQHFGRA